MTEHEILEIERQQEILENRKQARELARMISDISKEEKHNMWTAYSINNKLTMSVCIKHHDYLLSKENKLYTSAFLHELNKLNVDINNNVIGLLDGVRNHKNPPRNVQRLVMLAKEFKKLYPNIKIDTDIEGLYTIMITIAKSKEFKKLKRYNKGTMFDSDCKLFVPGKIDVYLGESGNGSGSSNTEYSETVNAICKIFKETKENFKKGR